MFLYFFQQEDIEQVILVGGATRVPKVQEVLLKAVGKEDLAKNINADEAAAMGAVYQAAALSKAFKVKPFLIRDAAVFPIQVEFTRESEEEGIKTLKHNKRILFQRMAPYPQRKVITFNRYSDDFAFYINYGDLSYLSQEDLSVFGSLNLTTVKLSGVGNSFQKNADAESKGIKAHFNMDESGVLLLDRVESVFETIAEEKEEESTLTKLGNTISTLFGGGSSEPAANVTEPVQEEAEEKQDNSEKSSTEEKGQEKTEEASSQTDAPEEKDGEKAENTEAEKEAENTEAEKEAENTEAEKEAENTEAEKEAENTEAEKEAERKAKPQKKSKISEDVAAELITNDILDPTAEDVASSKKKLQDLTDRDLAKQEREKSLNSLEAFIFETQDKLYQEDYQLVVTEEEKEQISSKLSEASEWMDEEGYTASNKQLREQLSQLRSLCKDMFFRVEERRRWPERLAALNSRLNTSSFFLRSAKLIPEDDQIFTEVELNLLEKVINETMTWKNETEAEQEKRSPKERPVLLSKDIESKVSLLERELNYLLNKANKANNTTKEKVIPPTEESADSKSESPEEVQPGEVPPTEESATNTDSDSQSQPTEESTTTGATEKTQPEKHIEDEL
ncbi:hypothetical protein JOQ06_018531 [Pogonophryne albipinna]|uniref:Hypoxia up-regulated protein 1 n=1 Tax=Pogonophryne albipinna TaxID=1090488 RepID=A0AAD6AR73_9TELE|nr:hypothetical protein JOQ06_018531 [Pogonophryne albipinna]